MESLSYHITTAWLFVRSDVKTVIIPQTILAVASPFSRGFTAQQPQLSLLESLLRLAKVLSWLYLTLLIENIANQRHPHSILEDSRNKPWRPLPSKRLTPEQARALLFLLVPCAMLAGSALHTFRETTTLVSLIWMYNDLGGANVSVVWRNMLNAGGLMCFSAGVTAITAEALDYSRPNAATMWILLSGCVIATTVHAQDLPDIVGDAAQGRRTIPLV